jgi:two-component system response regulator RegA
MTEQLLIVDDDDAFRSVLMRALTRQDFVVSEAHDVASAIAFAKEAPQLDKAIVDLKMSGPSGLSLIPELKRLHSNIEIVMLTGYSSVATAVEAVKLGASNYLCKPANTQEILAAFDTTDTTKDVPIPEKPPSVERLEWEHIQKVLNEYEGNISATARALGMHRRTLQRKLQKRPVKS